MASFYNNYYRYYRPYPPVIHHHAKIEKEEISQEDSSRNSSASMKDEKKSSEYYSFGPVYFKNPIFSELEEPIFEVLGIKLYLDDIIILGLLFFLYQEGVQDEMLFIALILLLVS